MMTDTETQLEKFKPFLIDEERAAATIEKYRRDVQAFFTWLPDAEYIFAAEHGGSPSTQGVRSTPLCEEMGGNTLSLTAAFPLP